MRAKKANSEGLQTRTAILDATEAIMREEGYAAVSSRRVAERAGLKSQLVYYHFGTMEELFLAVYRRSEESYFAAHARAVTARNPLRALWKLSLDPSGAGLELEFIALARRSRSIRDEIARSTQRFRSLQVAAIARVLAELGVPEASLPAEVAALALISVSRGLVAEEALGVSMGHQALIDYVEARLDALERGDGAGMIAAP